MAQFKAQGPINALNMVQSIEKNPLNLDDLKRAIDSDELSDEVKKHWKKIFDTGNDLLDIMLVEIDHTNRNIDLHMDGRTQLKDRIAKKKMQGGLDETEHPFQELVKHLNKCTENLNETIEKGVEAALTLCKLEEKLEIVKQLAREELEHDLGSIETRVKNPYGED